MFCISHLATCQKRSSSSLSMRGIIISPYKNIHISRDPTFKFSDYYNSFYHCALEISRSQHQEVARINQLAAAQPTEMTKEITRNMSIGTKVHLAYLGQHFRLMFQSKGTFLWISLFLVLFPFFRYFRNIINTKEMIEYYMV